MKTAVQRIVIGALLLIACQSSLLAQIATVSRNALFTVTHRQGAQPSNISPRVRGWFWWMRLPRAAFITSERRMSKWVGYGQSTSAFRRMGRYSEQSRTLIQTYH